MVARSNKEQNFERAFSDNCGSIYGCCACGKSFYDSSQNPCDELDVKLRANKDAVPLQWSVSWMSFEGTTYAMDCNCWVERAAQIMKFLDSHSHKIAAYFKLEKERKQIVADSAVVIE